MISLFKRRNSDADDSAENTDDSAENTDDSAETQEEAAPKGYTAPKGKPTPKRKDAEANANVRPVEPPKSKKEAKERLKERREAERKEQMEGMRRGDDRYLLPRDQGPIRRMIRNIVDQRRNAGSWFFGGTIVVMIGSLQIWPAQIRSVVTVAWVALIALFLLDAALLSWQIRSTLKERFPKENAVRGRHLVGHCFYGVMRSVVFRRLRTPSPALKIGDPLP